MKLIRLLVLLVSLGVVSHAADFEGTIRWSFAIEITDPVMKKEMADAATQMADPKMKEEMAEAKAALADPEMQAMMAQNPQMKAMMEQQLAMMNKMQSGGGNPMENIFPKAMLLRYKAGKTLSTMEGGPMPMEVLNLPAESATYLINRPAKTYSKLPDEKPPGVEKSTFTVTKTAETIRILGYECVKYVVTETAPATAADGGPARYLVWASTDVPGLDTRALAKVRFGQKGEANAFLGQIDGVPLKMEITMPQARITMGAVSLKAESLADALFTVPAGFVEKPVGF